MRFKTKKRIIKLRKIILQIIQIAIGTALMAVAVDLFLLPNQISSGGFSGIGTILFYLFRFPIGTTTLLLNIPLFIIALIKDGKKFFFNALIGTAFLSFFLNIFQKFGALTQDRFLACIYGGIITGIGTAIVLKANSSTGGTDLVAHIVRKIIPWVRTSMTIIFLEGLPGIGKTTLINKIRDLNLKNIYVVDEILENSKDYSQSFFMKNDIKKITKYKEGIIIIDRGPISTLSYNECLDVIAQNKDINSVVKWFNNNFKKIYRQSNIKTIYLKKHKHEYRIGNRVCVICKDACKATRTVNFEIKPEQNKSLKKTRY